MKTKQVKKIIRKEFWWWVNRLGLGYWHATLAFSDYIREIGNTNFISWADSSVEWKYIRFTVTFYPKAMQEATEEEIKRVVIHELMHVFLNEMRETGLDHEERVASMLAKAFLWVRNIEDVN